MKASHCPICNEALEVRDVTPCDDCGALPEELEHLRTGQHSYSEWKVFGDLSLVLCNFCRVDFDSYDPGLFGLNSRLDVVRKMKFVRDVEARTIKDKCCPACVRRLPFLEFMVEARERHSNPG